MIKTTFDILAPNDPSFLQELRRYLDGLESGEYKMQHGHFLAPVMVEPRPDGVCPKVAPSGHIVITLLLYKRPLSETRNSTAQKPPESGDETDNTKISNDSPLSVSNS